MMTSQRAPTGGKGDASIMVTKKRSRTPATFLLESQFKMIKDLNGLTILLFYSSYSGLIPKL